jgi:hypothetical protein
LPSNQTEVLLDVILARKDKKDRERGLERVKKKLGKGKSLKRLIPNYVYQKYVKIEGDGKVQLDDEQIRSEEC